MKLKPVLLLLLGSLVSACSPQDRSTAAATTESAAPANAAAALPDLGAAPSWKLRDLDGDEISSDDLKGRVVVVDFWATWCPPCREEIPGYIEMVKKYRQQGLVVVGISLDEAGPDAVKRFAEKHGINYSIVMGDQAVVTAFGGIEGIPTTFLIDRDGRVRDKKVGAQRAAVYEKKVAALLK